MIIAAGIISTFAAASLAVSSIVTFAARQLFSPEELKMGDMLMLFGILAVIAGLVFVALYPLDSSGNRKDEKQE